MTTPSAPPRVIDPVKSRAGIAGMRARWGPRRHVHLANLDDVTAGIIRAILLAAENAAQAKESGDVAAAPSR